jgi:acyl-CoA thioester hydrolase
MEELLKAFPVITEIKVRWGEMDAANHVNNVLYFRWAEAARFDYFEQLNIPVAPDEDGIGLVLGWQDCKYIVPVIYPDRIFLGTRTKSFERDRFIMETHFFSQKYNRLVAIGQHSIVCYDYNNRQKVLVPESLQASIEAYEAPFKKV